MSDGSQLPNGGLPPLPRIDRQRRLPSLIWLVPVLAAAIGLSLVIDAWRSAGPQIAIRFQTAEGLEVGKTLVKYRNVTVGHVTAIAVSGDHDGVVVTAELAKNADYLATADTLFWVARPRIGVGWVSGLDTLVSGAFIGAETGDSTARRLKFTGLEIPPALTHGLRGIRVTLESDDLGSVAPGAPVYLKRFPVGRVIDRQLAPGGHGVRVLVFIDAPNDRFVTRSTRFWNASGLDVTLGANGLKLKTESLASVLAGGIAFDNAPEVLDRQLPGDGATFTLFPDEATAMAPPDGEPHYVRMRFPRSLRGLSIGAPVEFLGINIGSVLSIDLGYEPQTQAFPVIVAARVFPRRMGRAYEALLEHGVASSDDGMARLVGQLVARGLRAQPRPANLLTGQLYIALDFLPAAAPVRFDAAARPLEIPAVSGSIEELQARLASVVQKLDRLPLDSIAGHLDEDLMGLHATLDGVNSDLIPPAVTALKRADGTLQSVERVLDDGAPWRRSVEQTVDETRRTLESVRSLADYLGRHPEALIRGRQAARAPAPPPPPPAEVAR